MCPRLLSPPQQLSELPTASENTPSTMTCVKQVRPCKVQRRVFSQAPWASPEQPTSFARVFRAQFGTTPARYVEGARVERARRHLEDGHESLDEIADICGFGSVERMRRSFGRAVGVGPSAYRERFRARKPRRSADRKLRRAG